MQNHLKFYASTAIKTILVLACVGYSFTMFGQKSTSKPAFKDRLVFGGNFALAFGNNTIIGLSPEVGYRITNNWTAGVGGSYYYFSFNSPGYVKYSTSIYGGKVFTRYQVFESLFVQTEFQSINSEYYEISPTTYNLTRGWIPHWYVGGGYYAGLGGSFSAGITVLYDLIQDPRSPWPNPVIRLGGIIGF